MARVRLVLAFLLGACTTAAIGSSASPTAPAAAADHAAPWPPITTLDRAERRVSPTGQARVAVLARGHNAFVARLEMDPGATVPEHRDATEEYIVVLQGRGTISIDGSEHEVASGSAIYMRPDARVSFRNGDEPMVALQVFAGPAPAAKYDAWQPAG
jgi:quercetin dioxygenase-like cupin family protein